MQNWTLSRTKRPELRQGLTRSVRSSNPFGPSLSPFCHFLQEGENTLSALDAFWLGLIDEVIGESQSCPRLFSEFRPDEEPPAAAPPTHALEIKSG